MRPEVFLETFFQEEAERINFVLWLADHHFEAKKFCLELAALRNRVLGGPPRRA